MSIYFIGLVRFLAYITMVGSLAITSLHISEVDVWKHPEKMGLDAPKSKTG